MNTVQLPFYLRLAVILLSVVLIYIILVEAKDIFIPLVFAQLVAVLLYPVARFLEGRLHLKRSLAVMISVVLFTACLVAFGYFFISQVISFSEDFPLLKTRFLTLFGELQHWLSYKFHVNRTEQMAYLEKSGNSVVASAAGYVSNLFKSMATLLLWSVFVFIYSFFVLFHRRLLVKFALALFTEKNRDKVQAVIFETKGIINGYLGGLLIEMVLVGTVNCVMFLIMGIKYAMLLGIMAAFLNIIPYLGIYTSIVITLLVTFANSSWNAALGAGAGLFVVHLLDSNFLMPRIVGGRVKMNSFVTILAVVIGNMVWGVPGMFLFVPVAGIMKLVCESTPGLEAWAVLMGVEEKIQKQAVTPTKRK